FRPWIKYLLVIIALGFMVWATPRSLIASLGEVRAMGGADHRFLRFFGVMTAKNTAVNLMILTTFFSDLLSRRANRAPTVPRARTGMALQYLVFALAAASVVGLGLGGYFVDAICRI